MPYSCCVPGCHAGYNSSNESQAEKNASMFRFPKNEELKRKWLSAIPRTDWIAKESHRVCSLHFEERDFEIESKDKREQRRQARETSKLQRLRLTPNAIPHIFPGLPSHYSVRTPQPRSSAASSFSRAENQNKRTEQDFAKFLAKDFIESLDMLKEKLKTLVLPDGCCSVIQTNRIIFHCFDYKEESPKLLVSITILNNLSVAAHAQSVTIKEKHFQHLLDHGHVKSFTALLNIIAHCKALNSSGGSKEQTDFDLECAVLSLQNYCSKCLRNDVHDPSKMELINFFIEQLQLLLMAKQARRYSSFTVTTAYLWQLTSSSLYKKLRELFILPSISRLRAYSGCLSVEACSLDLSYLKQRTEPLKEEEKLVTLMIDEVYTAKRIEYSNGAFVGLNEEGKSAKTVLAFMVQSTRSKFKDVVCLVPVHKLDAVLLRSWFDKVMEGLNDLLFVVAVSVDNHVCNR